MPKLAAFPHLHDLPGKVVQIAQTFVFAEYLADVCVRAGVIGDEPFLIAAADADAPENRLHFFIYHVELDLFADQIALVVFAEVGNKGAMTEASEHDEYSRYKRLRL